MSVVKAKLVRIGNSKGIRIPKTILEQCHIDNEVELEAKEDCLIIKSSPSVREGWDDAFKRMHENNDDHMLLPESLCTGWDSEEWEW